MNSFFKKLLSQKELLTALELKVLEELFNYRYSLIGLTLKEFAEQIFISQATISRTCKKLGYSGFSEFKIIVSQQVKLEESIKDIDNSAVGYINYIKDEFNKSIDMIDNNELAEIVCKLKNSRFVEIFGIGRSSSACMEGAQKLSFAGRNANARSDRDEQRIVARYLNNKDFAIFVSVSGETEFLIDLAKLFKENQVPTLSIVGRPASTLGKLTKDNISLRLLPIHINGVDMSSHYMFGIVFNLLAISYMEASR